MQEVSIADETGKANTVFEKTHNIGHYQVVLEASKICEKEMEAPPINSRMNTSRNQWNVLNQPLPKVSWNGIFGVEFPTI